MIMGSFDETSEAKANPTKVLIDSAADKYANMAAAVIENES